MNLVCFFAVVIEVCLPPGDIAKPSAVFPYRPGHAPVAFAWHGDDLTVDGLAVPFASLGCAATNGAGFVWRTVSVEGEPVEIRGRLDESAPSFTIPSFAGLSRRHLNGEVGITAATGGVYRVMCRCKGPRSPTLRQTKQLTLKAGEHGVIDLEGKTSDLGSFDFSLFDSAGRTFFKPQDWGFRDASFKFAIRVLYTDVERQIMTIRSDNWFGTDTGYRLRVKFLDFDSGEEKWTAMVPAKPNTGKPWDHFAGRQEQPVDVSGAPPGQFKCVVALENPEGMEVAQDYSFYAKPKAGRAEWDGITCGLEDVVPPPWSPPEFEDDGFVCWNRKVRFGGGGLVSSIVSGGHELLAGPVALVLDGKPLRFDSRLVRKGVSESDYELSSEGAPVRVHVHCEFDGFMWFDVTWSPPVKTLFVRVPVRRDEVVGFDDSSSDTSKLFLGKKGSASQEYNPVDKPFWWIGDGRGLMGGVDGFRGWRLKDTAKGFALEVNGSVAQVDMRFVDVPLESGSPRTFGFYLEPTPTKPKNMAFAAIPDTGIIRWTDHVERFFEDKEPGRIVMERMVPFMKSASAGKRVFYYNATRGVSATFPWWGWYGSQWCVHSPEGYLEEAAYPDRETKDSVAWKYGCSRQPGFRDWKIWGTCWFLEHPEFGVKDLYWDLSNPSPCLCAAHGCLWKDEFGQTRREYSVRSTREIHKRVYRVMKRKNPDAAMMGHLQFQRTPSDVFFDALAMGEHYDHSVRYSLSYYDVLTPDVMRVGYAARANETTITMIPQISRVLYTSRADKLRDYKPYAPENDRVIRHATAYFKIHDLKVGRGSAGRQWLAPDELLVSFGDSRRHSAYYTEDCPVSVSAPSDRFLYALYDGDGGRKLLVLLNDTDRPVTETVSIAGFAGRGQDIFNKEKYDFPAGSCAFVLPPRESRFIMMEMGGE